MKKLIQILSLVLCLIMIAGCSSPASTPEKDDTKDSKSEKTTGTEPAENKQEKPEAKGDVKTAVWPEYDSMSFIDFLNAAFEAAPEESTGPDSNLTIAGKEGWEDTENLDKSSLTDGKVPVTYIISVASEEEFQGEVLVFAVLDNKTNTLEIVGGKAANDFVDKENTEYSLSLAKLLLESPEDFNETVGLEVQ